MAKWWYKTVAGALQLAAGQLGDEAAVHALKECFASESCEAVLLLDAKNAINNLNRKLALHNTSFFCPDLSRYL